MKIIYKNTKKLVFETMQHFAFIELISLNLFVMIELLVQFLTVKILKNFIAFQKGNST